MSQISPAEYLLTLCTLAQERQVSFGLAVRLGASLNKFNIESTKIIHSLLTFSPAPDVVTVQFLKELEKVEGIESLVVPVRNRVSQLDSSTWATEVINLLSTRFTKDERLREIAPFTQLASEMLTYLLIATVNPGGKKTPQDTAHPTPDIYDLRKINQLLEEAATKKSQSALKQLLFWRDGFVCPFTGYPFKSPRGHVNPRTCHILPFSFHNKPLTLSALETFAGQTLTDEVLEKINHPCNAFNAQTDARDSYDNMAWGIEAVRAGDKQPFAVQQTLADEVVKTINQPRNAFNAESNAHHSDDNMTWGIEAVKAGDDQWKYYFREVSPDGVSATIKLSDGEEIIFGHGNLDGGQVVEKPSPEYCNLKLAIARAIHACGVADMIAEMDWDIDDEEAIVDQPVYFGGPFVPDETLFRRLEDRLLSQFG